MLLQCDGRRRQGLQDFVSVVRYNKWNRKRRIYNNMSVILEMCVLIYLTKTDIYSGLIFYFVKHIVNYLETKKNKWELNI